VGKLKEQSAEDIGVLGSGELVQSLMRRDLVDEFVLMIHRSCWGRGGASSPRAVHSPHCGSSTP
jgi:dihydrofolate reductase